MSEKIIWCKELNKNKNVDGSIWEKTWKEKNLVCEREMKTQRRRRKIYKEKLLLGQKRKMWYEKEIKVRI